jgi:hypothetical protein
MKQPSQSPVLYLRAYYFHHVLAPCQPPAPVRHYFAFSCLGGFIFRWPGGAVEVPAAVSMLHKIYRSLLKCLPSPSGKGVERRRSSYPQRTDRTEFPPSQIQRFDCFIGVERHQSDLLVLDWADANSGRVRRHGVAASLPLYSIYTL